MAYLNEDIGVYPFSLIMTSLFPKLGVMYYCVDCFRGGEYLPIYLIECYDFK